MIRGFCFVAVVFTIGFPCRLLAQQPEGPSKEHQWLKQFVGKWEAESEATMGPGQPPLKGEGTMTGRTLGGFWVINEIKVSMMGTTVTGMQTIGFDPAKKKYVGTWVDSMSNHMWNYEGTIDKTGKKLILEAEGPNVMAKGKRSKFRDTYEFQSADKILATSLIQMEDGKWVAFMTATMRRKKEK